jgi:hypothetical protein
MIILETDFPLTRTGLNSLKRPAYAEVGLSFASSLTDFLPSRFELSVILLSVSWVESTLGC